MNQINRVDLLAKLEAIQGGLSSRDMIEQSSCYIFKDGKIVTYNDEVACVAAIDLGIEGAVLAAPLLSILKKLTEEFVTVSEGKEGELIIKGKSRKLGVRMQKEILLPFDTVETPKNWSKLPDEFCEAVSIVGACASTDASTFILTCINITSRHIEACDNTQLSRYPIQVPVIDGPILVRRDSLKYITGLGVNKICQTDEWLHFKSASGLVLSARFVRDKFPPLSKILKSETPKQLTLPKGLREAADRADVFSSENADTNSITVKLTDGRVTIEGNGSAGWYRETKKVKYSGKSIAFTIDPKLLMEIVSKHNHCWIGDGLLRVKGGGFEYVTCLGEPRE